LNPDNARADIDRVPFTDQGSGNHTIGAMPAPGGNVTDGYGRITYDSVNRDFPAGPAIIHPMPEKLTIIGGGSCSYWFF
jgi:hypothetical protein